MKSIQTGEVVVLLMDIKSPETPFFGTVGNAYSVADVKIDPSMPSGYAVELMSYGSNVLVDKSAVVNYEDWKNIYNAVIKNALAGVSL